MPSPAVLGFSFFLVATGGFVLLAAWLLLGAAARLRPPREDPFATGEGVEGVIVLDAGGRVSSLNRQSRAYFGLSPEFDVDLEALMRRVRPAEALLGLCARPGRAQVLVYADGQREGRSLEARSYPLPSGMMIVLAQPEQPLAAQAALLGRQAVPWQIGVSLDLEESLTAILEELPQRIPADMAEVTVWDERRAGLTAYRLAGGRAEAVTERYFAESDFGVMLSSSRQVVSVERPAGELVRSYLGVSLWQGDARVGSIELGSRTPLAFRSEDTNALSTLAEVAAPALSNALRFQSEQRRAAELTSLAGLSQALGSARDPRGLFSRLVESVTALFQAEVLGFLIYQENQRVLEAQNPFQGLPPQIVEVYRAPVHPGGQAETLLLGQNVLRLDRPDHPLWDTLGLGHIARAASLRETLLVPLNSGGRSLGFLQVSNPLERGAGFTSDEEHLLRIIASQSSSVIENAILVQQSRQRAQRAESLRKIASLIGSAGTLDEILKFCVLELARLLKADFGGVFLVDPALGELRLHKASSFAPEPISEKTTRLRLDDPQFPFTSTGSHAVVRIMNLAEERAVIPFYQGCFSGESLLSAVGAPMLVRDEGVGELWFGWLRPEAFEAGDVQVVATAASQLGGVVERASLAAQTDESLHRRLEQTSALNRINRELMVSLDLKHLLQLVFDEALRITHSACGSITLFEEAGLTAQITLGDPLGPEFLPAEKRALGEAEPVMVAEFGAEEHRPHAEVQSLLTAPLVYHQEPVGLITLHAVTAHAYDATDIDIVQSLAVQASIALGNALLYQEQSHRQALLKRELSTMGCFQQAALLLRKTQPLEQALTVIAAAIQQATPFKVVLISAFDATSGRLQRLCATGLSPKEWEEARENAPAWESIQTFFQPEFCHGSVYFVPADRSPFTPPDVHTITLLSSVDSQAADAWDPDDILAMPLLDGARRPLGLISVDSPFDGCRPDRPTYEALEVMGFLAGLYLENHLYREEGRGREAALETENTRLATAAAQAGQALPLLLRRDLESMLSVRQLSRHTQWMRSALEIAERVNREGNMVSALRALGRELMSYFGMQVVLIAEKGPTDLRLIDTLGAVQDPSRNPPVNLVAMLGQRNPLRQVLTDGQAILIADLDENSDWRKTALLAAVNARSVLCLPISVADELTAGVLILGQSPLQPFSAEDQWIFAQLVRLVGVSLQDLKLLADMWRRIRDVDLLLKFTRSLAGLDLVGNLTALVENVLEAVPGADAAWVGLWNEHDMQLEIQSASGYQDRDAMLSIRFALVSSAGEVRNVREVLPLRAFRSGRPERVSEVDFATQYHLAGEELLSYRQATGGRLPVSAMLIPLSLGEDVQGVVMVENFTQADAFRDEDEAIALTFAQQTSLALENVRLYQAAQQRATQLSALTRVAQRLTSLLKSDELIDLLLSQMATIMQYETGTLWLRGGSMLTVAAALGFEDVTERIGLSVSIEDSMIFRRMIQNGEAVSVGDVRNDPYFPSLAEADNLSWLGVPLIAQSQVVGVIALEKREPDYYNPERIQLATTFAGLAAVALDNARTLEESNQRALDLDERSRRLAMLNRFSAELAASLDEGVILDLAGRQLASSLEAAGTAMLAPDGDGMLAVLAETPEPRSPERLPGGPLFDHLKESAGSLSAADVATTPELAPLWETFLKPRAAQSVLLVPLVSGADLHGWFLAYSQTARRFSSAELELARTLCNQAALAVQNARLFGETRRLTEDLERRVQERTTELRREHRNSQSLLRLIIELSNSLDMELVLSRALEVINEASGAQEGLIVLAQPDQPLYRSGAALARLSKATTLEDDTLEHRMARKAMRRPLRMMLVEDVTTDETWGPLAGDQPPFRCALVTPLLLGQDVLGALLLLHREPGAFSADQTGFIEAAARQFGIALNNTELFKVVRDQAERLGGMLREQQIAASRSRAILEAVADGVVVTEDTGHVTLFNHSAERILDLSADEVVGSPLETLTSRLGDAGRDWISVVHTWSEEAVEEDAALAERFELENGRVVAVSLAPVNWRDEFLGTVSIFRDVTHEVQVDRMKSEFVANVSHELRTPMTSIKGYVEILLMGAAGELNPQQTNFLKTVKANTERLNVLVNDLLDVSRIDAGQTGLNLHPLDLREMAVDLSGEFERRAREDGKAMDLVIDLPADLPKVLGDAQRLRQVLSSLLSNGYNYTPAGGQVTLQARPAQPGWVQVNVIDNGIGIEPENLERVFERFYRGEDALVLASAGTGLGLSIARTLVEMHGGKIWVESAGERGAGSRFCLTLQAAEPGA